MVPEDAVKLCEGVRTELSKAIVGQTNVVQELMISLFAQGHCLLIGVPGLAKPYWSNLLLKLSA